jgi:hypothetical protein
VAIKEAFDKKSQRKRKLDAIKKTLELEFEAVKTTR